MQETVFHTNLSYIFLWLPFKFHNPKKKKKKMEVRVLPFYLTRYIVLMLEALSRTLS